MPGHMAFDHWEQEHVGEHVGSHMTTVGELAGVWLPGSTSELLKKLAVMIVVLVV